MSEIFDFLKKTETDRRKKIPALDPNFGPPIEELSDMPVSEPQETAFVEELPATALEICKENTFDLSGASAQIKTVMDSLTLVGEQFRLLRSRLDLMQKQRGIRTILVTSTVPQEGKTFTASGLTGVLAQAQGKRVVLIDADMRKPKSGRDFGLNGSGSTTGLSEVLRGNVEFGNAVLASANPEFCFLPAGPLPSNPTELLSCPKFAQVLRSAAENYDWVIVDSPPALYLSDTTLISPLCDAVVFVVRADSTPSKLVRDAVNLIGHDHICGVVLNRQKQLSHSRYYYKYYYSNSDKKE